MHEATRTWFEPLHPCVAPRVRVVCMPHAGGSAASFRGWAAEVPGGVELWACRYPGRAERIDETPPADIAALADAITEAFLPVADVPFVLVGHSLGAAVAFEVARRLEARGHRPRRLVVSGRPAPQCDRRTHLHLRPDAALWADVDRLSAGGPAPADRELRRLLTPALRADYRLSETYRCTPDAVVDCPVVVVVSRADPEVTVAEARSWSERTRSYCVVEELPGDHFAVLDHGRRVLRAALGLRFDGRRGVVAPGGSGIGCCLPSFTSLRGPGLPGRW